MTEEEFNQLLARLVQSEVERQLAPVVTEVLQVLESLKKTDDQTKHVEDERRRRHRQTMLWELEDLSRLAGLDPAVP
jgi:hypothetical protein